MQVFRVFRNTTCLTLALMGLGSVAPSQAQAPDPATEIPQLIGFSINSAIDIPGAVLQPGSYVLRIKGEEQGQNPNEKLNVVQVLDGPLNLNEPNHVVAEIYARQIYDATRTDGPLLVYYEGTSSRRALKAWSHFPTNYSEQFVYPPDQAAQISKTTAEAPLSMPAAAVLAKNYVAKAAAHPTMPAPPLSAPVAPALSAPPAPAVAASAATPASNVTAALTEPVQPPLAASPSKSDPAGSTAGYAERAMPAPPAQAPRHAAAKPAPAASEPAHSDGLEFPKTAGDLPIAIWLGATTLVAFVLFKFYRRDLLGVQDVRYSAQNHALARKAAAAAYRTYKLARSSAAGKKL